MASRADFYEALAFVVLGVVLGGISASATYLILIRRNDRGAAACGACGYITKALTTFNCPECGADLREVGITRHKHSHVPFFAAVSAGLFIAFVTIIAGLWLSL